MTVDDSPSPSRPVVASPVDATPFTTSTIPINFLSILRRRATALSRLATLGVTSNACAKIIHRRREIERNLINLLHTTPREGARRRARRYRAQFPIVARGGRRARDVVGVRQARETNIGHDRGEVVRAVSTRDGVDARNVNGEVAMDVDARRVDLVEATLATCRAAEKAMFEATSAREMRRGDGGARAAFEIARATGERRSTRDRARASGAFEAVSSLARVCAACAACRAGSRRAPRRRRVAAGCGRRTRATSWRSCERSASERGGRAVVRFGERGRGREGNAEECLTRRRARVRLFGRRRPSRPVWSGLRAFGSTRRPR